MYAQEKSENDKMLAIQSYVDKYLKLPLDVILFIIRERQEFSQW